MSGINFSIIITAFKIGLIFFPVYLCMHCPNDIYTIVHPRALNNFSRSIPAQYRRLLSDSRVHVTYSTRTSTSQRRPASVLNPEEIMRGSNMSVANISAKIPGIVKDEDEQKLDDEWRLLIISDDAKNILSQNATTNIDTEVFWSKICHTGKYPLLSKLVKALLTIPVSNADCERIFSMVTLKKTEKRNRLKNSSLANEIVSGEGIRLSECVKFEPSADMIKSMGKNIFPQWRNDQ